MVVVFFSTAFLGAQNSDTSNATTIDLTTNWKSAKGEFPRAVESKFDDSKWKTFTLPIVYKGYGAFGGQDPGPDANRHVLWYRRVFKTDPNLAGSRILLSGTFANSYQYDSVNTQIYVNSMEVIKPMMASAIDITEAVKPGEENVLAVRIELLCALQTGERTVTLKTVSLGFSPDGRQNQRPADGQSGSVDFTLPRSSSAGKGSGAQNTKVVPDSRMTGTTTYEGSIGDFPSLTWQQLRFSQDGAVLFGSAFSRKQDSLLQEGKLFAWNPQTGRRLDAKTLAEPVGNISLGHDGRTLLGAPRESARRLPIREDRLLRCSSIWPWQGEPEIAGLDSGNDGQMLALAWPDKQTMLGVTESGLYSWKYGERMQNAAASKIVNFPAPAQLIASTDWIAPATFSGDSSTYVAWTRKSTVEVWDWKTKNRRCLIQDPIFATKKVTQLALSEDATRIWVACTAGDYAPEHILLFDGTSGTNLGRITNLSWMVSAIACSADGRMLAMGTDDRLVSVWDGNTCERLKKFSLTNDTAQALAISPDASVLASANSSRTLRFWNIADVTGAKPIIASDAGKRFERPVITSPAYTPAQEELYLLLRYQHLLSSAYRLLSDSDSRALGNVKEKVGSQNDYVRKQNHDEKIAIVGESVLQAIEKLEKEHGRQIAIVEQANLRKKEVVRLKEGIESEQQLNGLMGFAQMLVFHLSSEERYWSGPNEITVVKDEESERLSMDGFMNILKSSLSATQKKIELDKIDHAANENTRKQLADSVRSQDEVANEVQLAVEKSIAAKMDGNQLSMRSLVSKAQAEDNQLLSQRQATLRQKLGVDDPFTATTLIQVAADSAGTNALSADALFKQAENAQALTTSVPANSFYDSDRAELFALAGAKALQASETEIGSNSWARAQNRRAAVAVQCFQNALAFGAPAREMTGYQASLAWAQFQSGQIAEAYASAAAIREALTDSADFQINFARLACAAGKTSEGLDALEIAISRLGYYQLDFLASCADLPSTDDRFVRLTTIQIGTRAVTTNDIAAVELVLKSHAPLSDVQVEITYPMRNPLGAFHTKQARVSELRPEYPVVIALDNRVGPKPGANSSIERFSVRVVAGGKVWNSGPTLGMPLQSGAASSVSDHVDRLTALRKSKTYSQIFRFQDLSADYTQLQGLAAQAKRTKNGSRQDVAAAEYRTGLNRMIQKLRISTHQDMRVLADDLVKMTEDFPQF